MYGRVYIYALVKHNKNEKFHIMRVIHILITPRQNEGRQNKEDKQYKANTYNNKYRI